MLNFTKRFIKSADDSSFDNEYIDANQSQQIIEDFDDDEEELDFGNKIGGHSIINRSNTKAANTYQNDSHTDIENSNENSDIQLEQHLDSENNNLDNAADALKESMPIEDPDIEFEFDEVTFEDDINSSDNTETNTENIDNNQTYEEYINEQPTKPIESIEPDIDFDDEPVDIDDLQQTETSDHNESIGDSVPNNEDNNSTEIETADFDSDDIDFDSDDIDFEEIEEQVEEETEEIVEEETNEIEETEETEEIVEEETDEIEYAAESQTDDTEEIVEDTEEIEQQEEVQEEITEETEEITEDTEEIAEEIAEESEEVIEGQEETIEEQEEIVEEPEEIEEQLDETDIEQEVNMDFDETELDTYTEADGTASEINDDNSSEDQKTDEAYVEEQPEGTTSDIVEQEENIDKPTKKKKKASSKKLTKRALYIVIDKSNINLMGYLRSHGLKVSNIYTSLEDVRNAVVMSIEKLRLVIIETGSGKFTSMAARKELIDIAGLANNDIAITIFYTDTIVKKEIEYDPSVDVQEIKWFKFRSTADVLANLLQYGKNHKEKYILDNSADKDVLDNTDKVLEFKGATQTYKETDLGTPFVTLKDVILHYENEDESEEIPGYNVVY